MTAYSRNRGQHETRVARWWVVPSVRVGKYITVRLKSYAVMLGLRRGALWEGRNTVKSRLGLCFCSHKHPGIWQHCLGTQLWWELEMWWQLRWQDMIPLFLLFSHQHSENHDQCGHAEAYSTVMLWGNSQESNMPSCQSRLERNINRSTVATMVASFFLNTCNLTALVVLFPLYNTCLMFFRSLGSLQ